MGDVFISYRRHDCPHATGRLTDHLQSAFGRERVFRDIHDIAPGADFEHTLMRAIGKAKVLLAVIGPQWLATAGDTGRRRLDDPHDMVRREIESALAARLTVIPVLVEGARMPAAADLPPSLAAFARAQALSLEEAHWSRDCAALIDAVRRCGVSQEPAPDPGAQHVLAQLAIDLVELLARPGRLMRRLAGGDRSPLDGGPDARDVGTGPMLEAVRLWLVALTLGALVFAAVVAENVLSWVGHGALIGVLLSVGLGVVASLGWRVCGVRADWRQATAGMACLTGGAWLLAMLGLVPVAVGTVLSDPLFFDRVRAMARQSPLPWDRLEALTSQNLGGPSLAGVVLAIVVWLGALAWGGLAWNGLRRAWRVSVWTAVGAALATVGMVWALAALLRWAAGA